MGPVLFHKNDNKLIEFGDTTEFVVGRSFDHNLCIPDSTISRNQCVIKKVPEGEWLVEDMSSFKTTLVNGVNVPTSGLYIKCGDIITFGTLKSWQLAFYLSIEDMPPTLKRRRAVVDNDVELSSQESRSSRHSERTEQCSQPKKSRTQTQVNFQEKYEAVLSEKIRLADSVEELKEKVKELEEARDRADDILVSSHLDRKHLQTDYEDCCSEVDRLVNERIALLEELRENIQKREAAEAQANAYGSSTQNSPPDGTMEGALILKTIEVDDLKEELDNAKAKLAKAEETAQNLTVMKEKVYNDAVAIIEQEFLCCVCTDLMFEPVTLNCRHTMCAKCLEEWKKKQKKCPSCRTNIKTEVRPLMIDSFIDRIAPLLGDEFTKKRQEAKTEKWAPPNPPAGAAPLPPTRGRRNSRRGVGRGGRGGHGTYGGYGYANAPAPGSVPPRLPMPHLPPVQGLLSPQQVIDLTNHTSPRRRNNSDHTDTDEDSEDLEDFDHTLDSMDSFEDEFLRGYYNVGGYSDDIDEGEEEDDDDVDDDDVEDDDIEDDYEDGEDFEM